MSDGIESRFTYHPPKDDLTVVTHEHVRTICRDLAVHLGEILPPSRERSLGCRNRKPRLMPAASLRPCPSCGAPRRGDTCAGCGWESARLRADRRGPRPDLRRPEHRTRSRQMIAEHRAEHGDVCPGWPPSRHEPHPSTDLTLHHHDENPDGPASVLCRVENGRLGHPTRPRGTEAGARAGRSGG